MNRFVLAGLSLVVLGAVIGGQFIQEDKPYDKAPLVDSEPTTEPEAVSVSRSKIEKTSEAGSDPSHSITSDQINDPQSESVYKNEVSSEDELQIKIDTYAEYEDEYRRLSQNPDYPTMGYRMLEINARRPDSKFSPEEVLQALAEPAAWQPLATPPEEWLHQINDEDRKFIQFNRTKIETLVAGDSLEIPIENSGATYVMQVEQVEANVDGNITWRGRIDDGTGQYPASITQNSSDFTAGGFSTPDGHFIFQATNDTGWILASRGVARDNSAESDYIIPDIQ